MSLTPRTFKIFNGVRLDDDLFGQKELDYKNYPGLEVTISQIEVTIPAEAEDVEVVFPLESVNHENGQNLIIVPQYDRLSILKSIYQDGLTNQAAYNLLPAPLNFKINSPAYDHIIHLQTTRQFFLDGDILNHYGGNGTGPTTPVTWYFTNPSDVDQTVRMIKISFPGTFINVD
jgi:hypothetical protein